MPPRQKYLEIPDLEPPSRQPSPVFSSDEEDDPLFFVYCLIEDPVTTFVREHVNSLDVTFLVRYETVAQIESVFSNVPDGCTVQQLVDRLNLCLSPSARMRVYVVTNPQDDINYVVEVTGNNREQNVRRDPIVSPRIFDTTDSPASPDNSYDRGLAREMPTSSENPSIETAEASTSTDFPCEEIPRAAPTLGSNLPKYSPTSSTPLYEPRYSPVLPGYERGFSSTSAQFSPHQTSHSPSPSRYLIPSPSYSPIAQEYLLTLPEYSPTSPQFSPSYGPRYTPTSPEYCPGSPDYSPSSPEYSPTSPEYLPTLPEYSANHNSGVSPTSAQVSIPRYSPPSPSYLPESLISPQFSPSYGPRYSPTSPEYCPGSPDYSPSSPEYSSSSPPYSPTSPEYLPTLPEYSASHNSRISPTSAQVSSPRYSPSSPSYLPESLILPQLSPSCLPRYSPTSPVYMPVYSTSYNSGYSPTSPEYSLSYGPRYSPTLPDYSPMSPTYTPTPISSTPTSISYSPASPDNPKDRGVDLAMFYQPTSQNYALTFQSLTPASPDNSFDRGTAFDQFAPRPKNVIPPSTMRRFNYSNSTKKEVVEFCKPEVKTEIKREYDPLIEDNTLDTDSPLSPDNPYDKGEDDALDADSPLTR